MNALKRIILLSVVTLALFGCADSAQINQESAQSYLQTVNKARNAGVLDTTSTTAKRVQNVFYKMVPYADRENQTGQKFDWQINVVRDNELNA